MNATYVVETIRGIGGVTTDGGTANGTTWTKLTFTGGTGKRSGVWICHDPLLANPTTHLLVLFVNRGSAAPTVSTKSAQAEIAAGAWVFLPVAETVDVYVENDTGAATTTVYSAKEGLA